MIGRPIEMARAKHLCRGMGMAVLAVASAWGSALAECSLLVEVDRLGLEPVVQSQDRHGSVLLTDFAASDRAVEVRMAATEGTTLEIVPGPLPDEVRVFGPKRVGGEHVLVWVLESAKPDGPLLLATWTSRGSDAPSLPEITGTIATQDAELQPIFVDWKNASTQSQPSASLRMSVGPNPIRDSATIRFSLPERAEVDLSIFGPDGRRVATLVRESLPAGNHEAPWDGRLAVGAPAPSGLYFAVLRTPEETTRKKITLTHGGGR